MCSGSRVHRAGNIEIGRGTACGPYASHQVPHAPLRHAVGPAAHLHLIRRRTRRLRRLLDRQFPLDAVYAPVENHLSVIDSFDVSFSGCAGPRSRAGCTLPANRDTGQRVARGGAVHRLFGGRGLVQQDTKWAQAGYAPLIVDTRGQGYGDILGETADPHASAGDVAYAGLMTRGVSAREDYYYRRVWLTPCGPSRPRRSIRSGCHPGAAGGLEPRRRFRPSRPPGWRPGAADGVLCTMAIAVPADSPRHRHLPARALSGNCRLSWRITRDRYEPALAVLNYFDGVRARARARPPGAGAVLGGADGRCLPAVDSLCRLQRLRRRARRPPYAGEGH